MSTDPDPVEQPAPVDGGPLIHLSRESDRLMTAIQDIHEMEGEKRTVHISTPRFHELADRIVDVSNDVFRHATNAADSDDEVATTEVTIEQVADGDSHPSPRRDRKQ